MNGLIDSQQINLERYVRAKRAKEPEFADAQLVGFRIVNGRYYAKWEWASSTETYEAKGTVGRLLEALDRYAPEGEA